MDLLKRSIFLKQVKIKYINIQLITDRYFPFAIFIYIIFLANVAATMATI